MQWRSALLMVLVCGAPSPIEAVGQPSSKPEVGIEVEIAADRSLRVRLVNQGKETITVLTQGLTFRGGAEGGVGPYHWEIVLGMPSVTRQNGRVIVPALSRYGPVELMPGEVSELITVSRKELDELYRTHQSVPLPWGETRVVYEVHPFWGQRFDLWIGKVTRKVADGPVLNH